MGAAALLDPPKLYSRAEVLAQPCPVPSDSGVYAWYFDQAPSSVPTQDTHERYGHRLLYVGIAPKKPAASGKASGRTLRDRLRQHYALNAYGSTLRLTLGCLLGLELRRIESKKNPGTAKRMTFGPAEADLSEWMAKHARVVWVTCDEPWTVEDELIERLDLPLNLKDNVRHPFYPALTVARAAAKQGALGLPPI
jgi:hypothetical protein